MAKMPSVFRSPHDPDPNSEYTSYFVFNGPGAIFDGENNTQVRTIEDGSSKTILLVEAKRGTLDEAGGYSIFRYKPLPKIEGWVNGELLVGMADGSVLPISSHVDDGVLKAWITKASGENAKELPRRE